MADGKIPDAPELEQRSVGQILGVVRHQRAVSVEVVHQVFVLASQRALRPELVPHRRIEVHAALDGVSNHLLHARHVLQEQPPVQVLAFLIVLQLLRRHQRLRESPDVLDPVVPGLDRFGSQIGVTEREQAGFVNRLRRPLPHLLIAGRELRHARHVRLALQPFPHARREPDPASSTALMKVPRFALPMPKRRGARNSADWESFQ